MEKIFYTWSTIEDAIEVLASKIKNNSYKYITGIPRGGVVPAVMLSHKTGIPFISVETASVLTSEGIENIIVVDDICDTGKTLTRYKKLGFPIATIDLKKSAVFTPNYYAYIIPIDHYIVYPWEND